MKLDRLISMFILCILVLLTGVRVEGSPADSIGIRKVGQQTFIIHRVEQGETLYALTRKYGVSLDEIRQANPDMDQNLNIGQEIRIPYEGSTEPVAEKGRLVHEVQSGETLFGISRKYDVNVGDIRKWNRLRSNTLAIGDKLIIYTDPGVAEKQEALRETRKTSGKIIHIVNEGETLFSISEQHNVSPLDLKEWNRMDESTVYVGQELIIGFQEDGSRETTIANELETESPETEETATVKTKPTEEMEITTEVSDDEYRKVTQKGIARIIEGSESTKKYLAMHRNAPIGTIMKVRNEMNDLTVFVRVIGKLPDTDENRNTLLKISKTAYDRLGAFENQFPVEITYHP